MAKLIELKTFIDNRGSLTVFEDHEIPFKIKRVFYIYGVDNSQRAGHRHHKTRQALICLKGSCVVHNNEGVLKQDFLLNSPKNCLLLEPEDWHLLDGFTPDTVLMVLASEYFDEKDYIFEDYK
ncbi:MAG: WxcM-like domain-containing protein [Cytophagales bacterium]|nr:WxcM-like domain-containing protein [Cytophagales bacterium]